MKKTLLTLMALTIMAFGRDHEDALQAYEAGDYTKSAELFQKTADQGDALSQYNLGVMYENGKGVERDYKKSVELFQKSAEQGNAAAQYNLGVMYVMGRGVKKDKIKSYQLWLKAAKQGDSDAQGNLDILCKESPWACK